LVFVAMWLLVNHGVVPMLLALVGACVIWFVLEVAIPSLIVNRAWIGWHLRRLLARTRAAQDTSRPRRTRSRVRPRVARPGR
jgi:hypothetical protein